MLSRPGRPAAGEEEAAPAIERLEDVVAQRLGLAAPRPPVVGLDHVAVHVEEDREPGGGVLARNPAELGRAGVRRLGDEGTEPELHGVAQEPLGPLPGGLRWCRHSRLHSREATTPYRPATGAAWSARMMPGGSSRMRMLRKWISAPSDSRQR